MSTSTASFNPSALRDLLDQSRRSNHERGLTGLLLFDGVHFIQTLEGPAHAVEETYQRISGDPRHRSLIVALQDDIDARRFADWSMGFDTLSDDEVRGVAGFNDYMSAGTQEQQTAHLLSRAGVFHRLFRDRMR